MRIPEVFPSIEEFAEEYGLALDDPDLEGKYQYYGRCVSERKSMIADMVKYDLIIENAKTEQEREDAQARRDSIKRALIYLEFSEIWDKAYGAGCKTTLDRVASAMRAEGCTEDAVNRVIEQVSETC